MGACSSQQPLEERCRNKTMQNNAARRTLPQQNNVEAATKQRGSKKIQTGIKSAGTRVHRVLVRYHGSPSNRRKDRSTVKENDCTSTGVKYSSVVTTMVHIASFQTQY
jgi:hypothetical protein